MAMIIKLTARAATVTVDGQGKWDMKPHDPVHQTAVAVAMKRKLGMYPAIKEKENASPSA